MQNRLDCNKVVVPYRTEDDGGFLVKLSQRQQDCALLLVEGLTSKEIAKTLHLSYRTVEEYINILKVKFESFFIALFSLLLRKIGKITKTEKSILNAHTGMPRIFQVLKEHPDE